MMERQNIDSYKIPIEKKKLIQTKSLEVTLPKHLSIFLIYENSASCFA